VNESGQDIAVESKPDARSNDELDSLVDAKPSNHERPMVREPDKAAQPIKDEYEFVHNGKSIKANRDQMIKWAQMGYDRPQFQQKINQEKLKWDQERAEFTKNQQKWAPYQQIDQWAQQNPSQWQQIEQMWKQAQANPQGFSQAQHGNGQTQQVAPEFQPYISKIQSLEQQISQLVPTVQEWQQERVTNKEKEEDTKLNQEIQSIRQSHKDLDWDNLDESGKTLEMRVLEHAQETGIPTFRAALRDLLHDDLISRAQAQAKQAVSKGIQSRTRLGVLGESPTSQRGMPERTKSIKDTSYEEIEQEIRDEIRRGKAS
jgi:hypothetical protein